MQNDKSSNNDQLKRFSDTARSLGCDEDEAAFKAKLGLIAKAKPKEKPVKDER